MSTNEKTIYKKETELLRLLFEKSFPNLSTLCIALAGSAGLGTNTPDSDRDYYIITNKEVTRYQEANFKYLVHSVMKNNKLDIQILSTPIERYCHIVPNLIKESVVLYGNESFLNLKEPEIECYKEKCKDKTTFQINTFKGVNKQAYPEILFNSTRPTAYGYAKSVNLLHSVITWMARTLLAYKYKKITYTKQETLRLTESLPLDGWNEYIITTANYTKYELHYKFPSERKDVLILKEIYKKFPEFVAYFYNLTRNE